jgi:hypothetical protein
MRRVEVRAIHNRTKETVRYPRASGGVIEVPPGQDVDGPWFIDYDEREHGDIATPNDIWFTDSTTEFHWGSVTFWSPDAFTLGEG